MRKLLIVFALLGLLVSAPSYSSVAVTSPTPTLQQKGNPDARVWVNTLSSVYHCPGTRWYGKTKAGAYMTQKEALAKGNRPAYGKYCE